MGLLSGVMLLFLTLGVQFLNLKGESYYVRTENGTCEGIQNCHTLEDYAVNGTRYFENDNNIILLFFEGSHKSDVVMQFSNLSLSLLQLGLGECPEYINSDFELQDIETLVLHGVCIHGQLLATAKDVTIERCNLKNGPVMVSKLETVVVQSVNLYGSSSGREFLQLTLACDACSNVEISHSNFNNASTNIITGQCNTTRNVVTIKDSFINSAIMGSVTDGTVSSLVNITAISADVDILDSIITGGLNGGFFSQITASKLSITNCSITNNEMGGIYVVTNTTENNIVVRDSIVAGNVLNDTHNGNPYQWNVPNGVGLAINPGPFHVTTDKSYDLLIKNVTFENNTDKNDVPKVAFILGSNSTMVSDSRFLHNNGTAVAVFLTTTFTVTGSSEFIGNHGYEGGALLLFRVHLTIAEDALLLFERNTVENVGGAICLRNMPIQIDSSQPCFYKLDTASNDTNINLTFSNNRAQKGGDNIYGGTTNTSCTALVHTNEHTYGKPYNHIFHFADSAELNSSVASEPTRVCQCIQNQARCAHFNSIFMTKELYPGEKFVLQLVVVGADFGAVAGSVIAQNDPSSFLSELQAAQNIEHPACKGLEYTVHSEPNRVAQMTLSIDGSTPNHWYTAQDSTRSYIENYNKTGEIDVNLLSTPLFLNISMMPCPVGFPLNNDSKICTCHKKINDTFTTTCTIVDGYMFVKRKQKFWISSSNASDGNATILFSNDCLAYKCKWEEHNLNLSQYDEQCHNNRAGWLCGRCKEGYSLALGSQKCVQCKNNLYLLLILVFGVLGILLVFFIKVLDLTVADGYIHGLIFYCNIVWINKPRLLTHIPNEFQFLNVFLAWFNLDFGIETCFFRGLTTYTYTWLQFIFPIYILLISIIIILVAQKVNILGGNVVPVLATLLLLSYYKLLVIIVSALRIAVITEIVPDQESREFFVWESDGNVEYAFEEHIPLLVVAVLMLLCFCIPYTLALLFSRHLNRIKNTAMTRWMLKLKPIFDAYSGPFRSKREYWVGLLLLIRAGLLISSILTYGKYSMIYNSILIVIMSGLFFYKLSLGRLYRTKCLALMENISILNLIALSSLHILLNRDHSYIACVFVGLAFVQFLVLVIAKVVLLVRARVHYHRTGLTIAHDLRHSDNYSTIEQSRGSRRSTFGDSLWFSGRRDFSTSQSSVEQPLKD